MLAPSSVVRTGTRTGQVVGSVPVECFCGTHVTGLRSARSPVRARARIAEHELTAGDGTFEAGDQRFV